MFPFISETVQTRCAWPCASSNGQGPMLGRRRTPWPGECSLISLIATIYYYRLYRAILWIDRPELRGQWNEGSHLALGCLLRPHS